MSVVIFQLTDSDRLIADEIKHLLSNLSSTRRKLIEYIKGLDPVLITKLAHHNKELFSAIAERTVATNHSERLLPTDFISFCEETEELQTCWKDLIPKQKLVAYPNFTWAVEEYNPFLQLRSNICLIESFRQNSEELAIAYREEAVRLGCFNAQFCKLTLLIDNFSKAPIPKDSARDQIFALASDIAYLHKSPGYCLLAITYFVIANCYLNRAPHAPIDKQKEYQEQAYAFYKNASSFFDGAKTLEAVSAAISKPALHNVVLGRSFFPALQKTFPYIKCSSIAALEQQLEASTRSLPSVSTI